jgi:hypothetical protein
MALNKGYLTAKTNRESDETYTPEYAVMPIIKHLKDYQERNWKENLIVWCPFDTEESYYVKLLRENGFTVIATHIDNGENFFYHEPSEYDIIVSNPPFSIKDDIIKRLYELNKPYAMLLPIPSLQGQKRFPYMKDCQALIFDKRINYFKDMKTKEVQKGVSFGSFYLCRNFLSNDLIFEELEI